MSAEKGLSGQTQLLLLLLAFLPAWYLLAQYTSGGTSELLDMPYFMECLECGLKHPCGSDGIAGMRCPRCTPNEGTMLFRSPSAKPIWDLVIKLLIGVIAFLAMLVLIFAGHNRKTIATPSGQGDASAAGEVKNAAEIRKEFKQELKAWVQDLIENRRKRSR